MRWAPLRPEGLWVQGFPPSPSPLGTGTFSEARPAPWGPSTSRSGPNSDSLPPALKVSALWSHPPGASRALLSHPWHHVPPQYCSPHGETA